MEAPQVIARKFLNRTNRHLFLTGKAGTGKTTFLRAIVNETHKKAVIAAPTGVAAINAGGVTLHSLFQLPFGTFVPSEAYAFQDGSFEMNTPKTLRRHMQMNATKRRLIQEIELLIIDEVSMLRADILDAVDNVLRTVRRKGNVPFGGVQLLLIGDLLQLPPVVKDGEWSVLKNFYKSIHFFEALALQGEPPLYLELEKIYRQTDREFISLLNNLRDNEVTTKDVERLNACYRPGFSPSDNEGYIYLTTHNRIADRVNREELERLSGKMMTYRCIVEGDFKESQYPLEAELRLKEGAQVMFMRNDSSGYRRYFNGKIGTVITLGADEIEVGFSDGSDSVEVEKETWQNKRYRLDKVSNEINEELIGSFTHYPLKLAWAVTVHKSQGLTFDKAIIDVENAFAPGQIYVALSRLTSLDGLVLSSRVPVKGFVKDTNIEAFAKTKPSEGDWDPLLEEETHKYIRDRMMQYFNFSDLENAFSYHLNSYTKDAKRSAKQRYLSRVEGIYGTFRKEKEIASKFLLQIGAITRDRDTAYLEPLKSRVMSALDYFEPKLKYVSMEILGIVEELKDAVGVKVYITELTELEANFYSKLQYLRKAVALIESAIQHSDLTRGEFMDEREREERASLDKLGNQRGRRKTKGKTGSKVSKGSRKKGDSKKETFEMFKAGKNLDEIAEERGIKRATIEGHLTEYIKSGEIDILKLMDEEKIAKVKAAVKEHYKDSVLPVKRALGEEVSFGEIRWVMAVQ